MICSIKRCEIEKCVEVIKKSFLTVAQEYGFTEENAPRFTAFSTTSERLNQQYDEGRLMYGYMEKDIVKGKDMDCKQNIELWDAYHADGTLAGCDLIRGEKSQLD